MPFYLRNIRSPFFALALLVLLHTVLIATTRLFPFTDLPNHLAAASILAEYDDPGAPWSGLYELTLFPRPNIMHLLICGGGFLGSPETANRILFCLYAALLPVSVLLLIRRVGGNAWFSLLSMLFLYNYNVTWGFVGFALSLPVLMLFALVSDRAVSELHPPSIAASGALLLLLFLCHALMALFAGSLYVVHSLRRRSGSVAETLSTWIALLPAAAIFLLWWRNEVAPLPGAGHAAFLQGYLGGGYLASLPRRAGLFFNDNAALYSGAPGRLLAAAFTACVAAPPLVMLVRRIARHGGPKGGSTPSITGTLLILSAACYILMPEQIPGFQILYERFGVLLILSGIIAGSRLFTADGRPVLAPLFCAACLIHLVLWTGYFRRFDRENRPLTADLFPAPAAGVVLTGHIADYRFVDRPVYIHFPSYFTVWRGGVATNRITEYRFGALRRKVSAGRLPDYDEWAGRKGRLSFEPAAVTHLLVRGILPPSIGPGAPRLVPLRRSGEWKLFAVEPADPPDP